VSATSAARHAHDFSHALPVILPIDEFALVAQTLEQRLAERAEEDPFALLAKAAADPLFLADLEESMEASAPTDADGLDRDQ
jgi:hypothetical protein